jgi:hypothetical protein
MRDSADLVDPVFLGLDFLALAREEVDFLAEEALDPRPVRVAVDCERDFFGGIIFVSPLNEPREPEKSPGVARIPRASNRPDAPFM